MRASKNSPRVFKYPFVNENTTKLINDIKNHWSEESSPLTKEMEDKMIQENLHDPEKLRELLIYHNIRLVFLLAKKYVTSSMDFDELVQRGMYGLMIASTMYKVEMKSKFSAYASYWIRKLMLEEYTDKYLVNVWKRAGRPKKKKKEKDSAVQQTDGNLPEAPAIPGGMNDAGTTKLDINPAYIKQNQIVLPNVSVHGEYAPASKNKAGTMDEILSNEEHFLAMDIQNIVKEIDLNAKELEVYNRLILDDEPTKKVAADINLSCYNTKKLRKSVLSKIRSKIKSKFAVYELEKIYPAFA